MAVPISAGVRVYPRLRGGTTSGPSAVTRLEGLSPLARGNRFFEQQGFHPSRSIPACAGEPHHPRPLGGRARVYPRLRGGTMAATRPPSSQRGLSPLARGNQAAVDLLQVLAGSIPACAGEPCLANSVNFRSRVYPRLRGGTMIGRSTMVRNRGLSPLARGNHLGKRLGGGFVGSIPACAGEPPTTTKLSNNCRVYPRLRGGTGLIRPALTFKMGLSPLARGNHHARPSALQRAGSIPACAGEPLCGGLIYAALGVYPRLRGGTTPTRLSQFPGWGLSPLARGNRWARRWPGRPPGSIPACAGEPARRASVAPAPGVYPRLRGGTGLRHAAVNARKGLSPLARGNPRTVRRHCRCHGSIPACAGEPRR